MYRYCKISSGRSTPLEKSKVHPRTGYDGPVGKQMYSSTLSLTSALDEGRWSTPRPGRFTRGKENRCPLYSKLGGLQAGLDRCGKSRPPTGIRSPDRPAGSQSLYRLSYRAHTFMIVPRRILIVRNVTDKICSENQNTFYFQLLFFFSKIVPCMR